MKRYFSWFEHITNRHLLIRLSMQEFFVMLCKQNFTLLQSHVYKFHCNWILKITLLLLHEYSPITFWFLKIREPTNCWKIKCQIVPMKSYLRVRRWAGTVSNLWQPIHILYLDTQKNLQNVGFGEGSECA